MIFPERIDFYHVRFIKVGVACGARYGTFGHLSTPGRELLRRWVHQVGACRLRPVRTFEGKMHAISIPATLNNDL
jgi:hypothetical protein